MAIDYDAESIPVNAEYLEMETMVTILAYMAKYASLPYEDEGTAFYKDGVLIDTDRWAHESSETAKMIAIHKFFEVTPSEVEAWCAKHKELAYWISEVVDTATSTYSDLQDYIDKYELTDEDEEAYSDIYD